MTFDPGFHVYRDDAGTPIPSVTQILADAGIIDARWYTAESRDRGSAVHELAERYANGERFDKRGRELASLEYVNAFARWQADNMAYAIETECMIHGSYNGKVYAGKFDGLFEIRNQRVLIDLKSGAPAKWHAIQLAAYAMASFDGGYKVNPDRVSALYFHADGTYVEDRLSGARLLDGMNKFKECL